MLVLRMILLSSLCRALLQTQVPRPPMSSTRKNPSMMDRKSVGAPLPTRLRRYTNVGISSSTDKPPSKRNPLLGQVANPDFESSGTFFPTVLRQFVGTSIKGNLVSDHVMICRFCFNNFMEFFQGTVVISRYISPLSCCYYRQQKGGNWCRVLNVLEVIEGKFILWHVLSTISKHYWNWRFKLCRGSRVDNIEKKSCLSDSWW